MRECLDSLPFQLQTSSSETATCNNQFSEPERWGISDCELCYHYP